MNRGTWLLAAAAVLMLAGGALGQSVVIGLTGGPDVKVAVDEPARYWIGVALAGPVQESEDEPGLQVVSVVPGSPAAKAGIEPGDRLLKAGKKTVTEIGELTEAIDACEGKPLKLEVARDDEVLKLQVIPAARPAGPLAGRGPLPPGHDVEALREWVEKLERGDFGGHGPFRFRILGPGAIVPGTAAEEPQPEDMTITVTKKGDRPARVVVKQGDQTWKAAADELETLPDEVRPHVERLLGRRFGSGWGRAKVLEEPKIEEKPLDPKALTPPEQIRRHLDEQMEQLHKQLEEMNERIEELYKQRIEPAKEPDKV